MNYLNTIKSEIKFIRAFKNLYLPTDELFQYAVGMFTIGYCQVCSGRLFRSPPLECIADGLGCLFTAGPSGDGPPNESWRTQLM